MIDDNNPTVAKIKQFKCSKHFTAGKKIVLRYTAVYRDLGDTGIVTSVSTVSIEARGYRTTLLPLTLALA